MSVKVKSIDPNDVSAKGEVSTSAEQEKLLAFIKRRHPAYEESHEHWSFLEDCYEGGPEWFKENIFRYLKEGAKEFKDRLRRAYRFNHSREVVDLINKYLFKQNIVRNIDDAPQSVKDFWLNSSKTGLTIEDLARQMSLRSSIQGRIGVVVDNNHRGEYKTLAQQKAAGSRIYAYMVRTEQLLDYAFDESGELLWVKIAETVRDDQDPITSSGEESVRYRLWTRNDWKLYKVVKDKDGGKPRVEVVSEQTHGLGMVPVILVDNVLSDEPYESPALIDDIAYLDRAVANYLSNIDAIIQDQTFSQLVMPAQGILPGEDGKEKVMEMGTKRVFLYDGQGGAAPQYISPDVKQAEVILSTINKIINEIYHTVGLAGERTKQDNAVGIDNSSGVAKAYDFEKVNALLSAKAHSLERAENKIIRIVAAWAGDSIKADLVSYPDNFDTRGLYDEFDIAGHLILTEAPLLMRKTQMKTIAKKLFPQIKKSLLSEIEKEIDSMKDVQASEPTSGDFNGQTFQGAVGPEESSLNGQANDQLYIPTKSATYSK